MPRRFTDAKALLGHLLDRYEAGTASPVAYPDYRAFASKTRKKEKQDRYWSAPQEAAACRTASDFSRENRLCQEI
jgi:hypothetical protein